MSIFTGRIGRGEFFLGVSVTGILIAGLAVTVGTVENLFWKIIIALVLFFLLVFYSSIFVRRLHDFGKSGWFALLALIPYVSILFLIFLMYKKGDGGNNRFGQKPKPMYF